MQSKSFYFSGENGFTHQFELREDGFFILKNIGDEMEYSMVNIKEEELEQFFDFLASFKNNYKTTKI